jgi:arginine decarboxylase
VLVPVQAYLSSGIGTHREELVAFELALRDAGVAAQNLVAVSSILPPGCELIDRGEGEKLLQPGQILHVVMSREETNEAHRQVGASIGVARPTDPSLHGFVSEYGDFGRTSEEMSAYTEDLAATMLATTLGIDFDGDLSHAERSAVFRRSGKIADTRSITAVTRSAPGGVWTCCVSVCVFIMEWMLPNP